MCSPKRVTGNNLVLHKALLMLVYSILQVLLVTTVDDIGVNLQYSTGTAGDNCG